MVNTELVKETVEGPSVMSVTLDIADVVSAVIWPLLIILLLLLIRKHLPVIFTNLGKIFERVQKLSLGDFTLELAKGAAFTAQWTPTDSSLDLRKGMSSAEISDSTANHFITQLTDQTLTDYAIVDLGEGHEWLSSRLYILSILLKRSKNIRAFVFVKRVGSKNRRLIGWAKPDTVRWSLTHKFPWLENAFASSYSEIFRTNQNLRIVTQTGMLGNEQQQISSHLMINLLRSFLAEIQFPNLPPPSEPEEWVKIKTTGTTFEHACWLTADDIEEILVDGLYKKYVPSGELNRQTGYEQIMRLLQVKQRYIPVVDDKERFQDLIDRQVVMEYVAAELIKT